MFRNYPTYLNYQMMQPGFANREALLYSPWQWLGPMFAMLLPLLLIEVLLKGYALWRAGRQNQLGWFIALLVLNTIGILPLIYLVFFQRSGAMFGQSQPEPKSQTKKK